MAGRDDDDDFFDEEPEDFLDEPVFEEEDVEEPGPALTRRQSSVGEAKLGLEDDAVLLPAASEWRRPPLPPIDPSRHSVAVQNLDIDYTVGFSPSRLVAELRDTQQKAPQLRIYGVSSEGNSVMMHVHGFFPYMYIPAWKPDLTEADLHTFGSALNAALQLTNRNEIKALKKCVLKVQIVQKESIWGFKPEGSNRIYLKITCAIPALIATSRSILERGLSVGHYGSLQFQTYESNLPYVLRFMVDANVKGAAWVEAPAGTYMVRKESEKISHCQLEVDIAFDKLLAHEPQGEWLKLAPVRVLSFDIECAGRKGHFPQPEQDPVIQIANVLSVQNQTTPITQNVFTLKSCAPIAGAHVFSHETEDAMLRAWRRFFVEADPDIITGYNIGNFDLPYLLDRAKTLKAKGFGQLGRIRDSLSTIKNKKFSSKAYGTHEDKEIAILGRVQFDLLQVIRREYKLRSYTLNAVCAHFLNAQKEDVHYSIISDLQNGNAETRRRLAVYCLKDAQLPMRLAEKLLLIINNIEMARVTGVPLSYLLTRGQQIKVVSQLYRKAGQKNLLIPVKGKGGIMTDEKYEGATVIEPKKAYYDLPIATLDFASLYPSIMMAHNLCYASLLAPADASRMKPEDYVRTPNGDYFVKKHVRQGLLPEILIELLQARKRARKEMADAKDPFIQAVLNGRQLALKISANSVYGFTGAQVGQLPCLEISASVTAFGREMIMHTKKVVERTFTRANGYEYEADVIYGDTDSVMVKFGPQDVKEAMALGAAAAELVSKEFVSPIKLEFEKVYFPYLLMNKKRYAGLYWTRPDKWDKMDTKGIETVRRDNCALVAQVVTECLNKILIDRSVESAVQYAKDTISDLLTNKLDLSLLVISKSLGKSAHAEDYAAKQAHVELAARMRKRDPSTAPAVGERVAYVITKGAKGARAYELAEDPIYVLENDIPIDTTYYLQNQLTQPLTRIFEPILGEDHVKSLFAGDHTRKIKVMHSAVGGIMKFTVKKRTCVGCKVPLGKTERTVCAHCAPNIGDLYMQQMEKVREYEELYSRAWTQCQRCQGSLHQDVLCTSRDCPIFYRRKKVQKDLKEAQGIIDEFSS